MNTISVKKQLFKYRTKMIIYIFRKMISKMNLETRKINFIQEFLNLDNEDIILGLENFLRKTNTEQI